MNWYLFGVCFLLFYLLWQTFGNLMMFKAMIKMFSTTSEMFAEMIQVKDSEKMEVVKNWAVAQERLQRKSGVAALVILGAIVFLVMLMIHGRI